jgi:hypothetical protein
MDYCVGCVFMLLFLLKVDRATASPAGESVSAETATKALQEQGLRVGVFA